MVRAAGGTRSRSKTRGTISRMTGADYCLCTEEAGRNLSEINGVNE